MTTTSSLGKVQKGSFTVSVERAPRIDIAAAIQLVLVSHGSDGTARATIKDSANPYRYEIQSTPKGIVISREYNVRGTKWEVEGSYRRNTEPGVLAIKDEETSTKHSFKVIAFEHNALIVRDITPPETSKGESKPSPLPTKGSRLPYKQGPADPVAAVASVMVDALPQPTYYRWVGGKSLKELLDPSSKNSARLKPVEVREILRRVSAQGPIIETLLSSGD